MHLMATSLCCHDRVGGSKKKIRCTRRSNGKRERERGGGKNNTLCYAQVKLYRNDNTISVVRWSRRKKEGEFLNLIDTHLRLREVDEGTFLLREVLGGPLLVLALILEDLDLVFAAEIVAAAAAAHVRHYCWPSDGHRLSCLRRSAT